MYGLVEDFREEEESDFGWDDFEMAISVVGQGLGNFDPDIAATFSSNAMLLLCST